MKPSEKIALDIIGDILKTYGQREHEIDYAAAGRDQIMINTNDGRQAQFVKDKDDNIFFVLEGVIYPIAKELVNQASDSESHIPIMRNATLAPYNLNDLESRFNSNPKEWGHLFYTVQEGGEYLSDVAEKFDIHKSDRWCRIFSFNEDIKNYDLIEQRRILNNRKKLSGPAGNLMIMVQKDKTEIKTIFSYKWYQDLNNDGLTSFNEFNQIKRTFYNDEDFNIAIDYQVEKGFNGNLEMKIFEDYTGELVFADRKEIVLGGTFVYKKHIPKSAELPVGLYLIHTNLIDDNSTTVSSASERFEIIPR